MKYITFFLLAMMISVASQAQLNLTIYEIQGQQPASPYDGQAVKTSGIVSGVFGAGYFIQDGQGEWNGIYVYGSSNVALGDEVEVTGTVVEYFELTEINNITDLQVISSGNDIPEPEILGTWDLNDESWESVLVKVEEAICTNTNLGYGEWELNDGSGPCRVDDIGIVYTPDQGISYAVTGPLFYSFDNYKIEPRDESDIQILETIYFLVQPEQFNLDKSSFTLTWETNTEATTELFYGTTPEFELGHLSVLGNRTLHEIELTGLTAGSVYYVRPFSVATPDTTPFYQGAYATVSNSSGKIKLIFNHDVDETLAIDEIAVWTPHIADSVISMFNMAQQTLDVTMYEQESDEIVAAINSAYDRGVQVRYITDDIGNNSALENLNADIPVLYGNTEAIMHDKFIIIDAASENDCWIMTGSLNHTVNNLGWDFNNLICLQDQSLAKAFTMEFEEMWGSEEAMYNEANALFGANKTDNTPHKFVIDGIPVELYFSPSDGTTSKIAAVIDGASEVLEFGIMVFTENVLGNAVLEAHQRGVFTTGIIDYVEYSGSEYDYLKSNGVIVRNYVNPDGTSWPDGPVFHHKYMISDFNVGSTNVVLVTGSHNWSASAESINDENTLIIHDLNLANQFHQEFTKRFHDQLTPIAMDDDTLTPVNTAVDIAYLENDFIPEDVSVVKIIIDGPYHGNADWNGDFVNYQPEDNYIGYDSLRYTLSNSTNAQLEDSAWVRIKVGNVGIDEINSSSFDFWLTQSDRSGIVNIHTNIGVNQKLNITIFDQLGRTVGVFQNNSLSNERTFEIDLSGKPAGIYFVKLSSKDYRKTRKIFVGN